MTSSADDFTPQDTQQEQLSHLLPPIASTGASEGTSADRPFLGRLALLTSSTLNLILLFAVACIFVNPGRNIYGFAVALGVTLAQAAAASVLTVFDAKLPHRTVFILVAILFSTAAFVAYAARTGAPGEICAVIIFSVAVQWLASLAPLAAMRRAGWKMVVIHDAPADSKDSTHDQPFRFEIRHILLWTTAIAGLLGVGRALMPVLQASSSQTMTIAFLLLIFVLGNALLTGPFAWSILSGRHRLLWLLLAMAGAVLIAYLEGMILRKSNLLPTGAKLEFALAACGTFVGVLLSILIPLALMKRRLVASK